MIPLEEYYMNEAFTDGFIDVTLQAVKDIIAGKTCKYEQSLIDYIQELEKE